MQCDAAINGIEFGCGVGNDNIIGCTAYVNRWKAQEPPTSASISSAIECLLHPQDADDSDMAKAIDTAVRAMKSLKAQEPRVMTLEEAKAMKRYTICAVEQRSKVLHTTFNAEYRGTLTIGERNYLDFGLYADVNPFRRSERGYGKTWRCWTAKPTDEQRKSTLWE